MLHRAYFLLILLFLTLVSCGSHKMAGPGFGGDAELADWTPKEEGRKPEVSSTIECPMQFVVSVEEVKSSNSIEVVEKQIHKVDDQKNVLVQPTHHRPILLLDSQAIDSNQAELARWKSVTNTGKALLVLGIFMTPISHLHVFGLLLFLLGPCLMIIGSKKYHLYKPAIRPTSQPAVVQESSEVLRLKHVKVFWDFALGLGLGSIGLSLIAILSSPFAAVSNGFFFLLYGGIVLTLISIIGTLIVAIKLQKATATSSDSAS